MMQQEYLEASMRKISEPALRTMRSMAILLALAVTATFGVANAQQPQPQQAPQIAPPKAYKPVGVKAPLPSSDASFTAFRKQLADIAQKKDRAALQKLVVAKGFFWESEGGEHGNPKASSFDNFSQAVSLDDKDGGGWDILAAAAQEPTLEADEDRKGVMCGPASPQIDEQSLVALIKDTGTDADEWAFPNVERLEVRTEPKADAPVAETLGQILVRVYPEENNSTEPQTMLRIVTPSGKLGYVPMTAVLPIVTDQLCYIKDAGGWKITGYAGG
jgi:hypothetical protein